MNARYCYAEPVEGNVRVAVFLDLCTHRAALAGALMNAMRAHPSLTADLISKSTPVERMNGVSRERVLAAGPCVVVFERGATHYYRPSARREAPVVPTVHWQSVCLRLREEGYGDAADIVRAMVGGI